MARSAAMYVVKDNHVAFFLSFLFPFAFLLLSLFLLRFPSLSFSFLFFSAVVRIYVSSRRITVDIDAEPHMYTHTHNTVVLVGSRRLIYPPPSFLPSFLPPGFSVCRSVSDD